MRVIAGKVKGGVVVPDEADGKIDVLAFWHTKRGREPTVRDETT